MKDKIIFLILICLLISCENDRKGKTVSPRIKSFTKVSSPSNNEIIKKGDSIFIEIKSIGSIIPSQISQPICEFFSTELQIPKERIYIFFQDVDSSMWAWNGKTFG